MPGKVYGNIPTTDHNVELRDLSGFTGTNYFEFPDLDGGTDTILVANLPQTLTNKTLTGTNTIRATQLGVTGGSDVIIGASVAPEVNMALISTSATNAEWQVVPGSYYQYEESSGSSNTTSTNFQTKLTLTTPTIPIGTYRIGWKFQWQLSSTTLFYSARIRVNGATIESFTIQPQNATTSVRHPVSGFDTITLSGSPQVVTFTIQYCVLSGSATAYIQSAALEICRVS